MSSINRLFSVALLVLASMALGACDVFDSVLGRADSVHLTGPTMGTSYNVKFVNDNGVDSEQLHLQIDLELARINSLMSTYDPNSELSRFNQSKTLDGFSLAEDTITVIQAGKLIGEQSEGYLDITVGPLVNLWGFGPAAKPEKVPTPKQITSARQKTGLNKLILGKGKISKGHSGMYVDLSTIAKGFAVDQVALMLQERGIANYLVEIGGEMQAAGVKSNGHAWTIAIEKPVTNERAVQQLITIGNNGLATSGDYRNYYEEDGRRYSHLIDPTTGYPIEHNLVSVTVVHPSTMMADGYATAISVMGKDKGLKMAQTENLAVFLITKENGEFKQYNTPEFNGFLVK